MTDHDGARDAEPIQHVAQYRGLIGRRAAAAAFTRAVAQPGAVDEDDAMAGGEPLAEREPHVFEIAAGAVDNNDRRCACRPSRIAKLDDVLTQAVDRR